MNTESSLRNNEPRPKRLSRIRKAGYGSTELGLVAVEVLVQVYLLKFYNVVVGLPAGLTGLALALGILWDAVTDPMMGAISDRTRSRWGRRRPYFLPGALALSLFFIVLFNPPAMDSNAVKFLYLIFGFLLVSTSTTVLSVPHVALGGELSFDRNERTVIYGYRRLFSTLGLVLGTALPAAILGYLGDESNPDVVARSRGVTAFVLAIPIMLTAFLAFVATKGRDSGGNKSLRRRTRVPGGAAASVTGSATGVPGGTDDVGDIPGRAATSSMTRKIPSRAESEANPPFRFLELALAQRDAWKNRMFLPLLLSFLVAGIARTLNGSFALYYYEYRLQLPESFVVQSILLPFFLSLLVSIPLWIWISRRFGKKWPAFWGALGLGVLTVVFYPIFEPGETTAPIIVALVGGIFAGSIVLLDSLIPDTVDYDELKTGQNREGLYFGVWKLGTKLSRALGLLFAGLLLQLIGFQEGAATQSEEVGWRLALLFGPGVGVFFVLAAVIFTTMPLTDERHARIQRLLSRKRDRRRERELQDRDYTDS